MDNPTRAATGREQRSSRPNGRSQAPRQKGGVAPLRRYAPTPQDISTEMMNWGRFTTKGGRERRASSSAATPIQPSNNRTEKQKTVFKGVEGQRPATQNGKPLEGHRKAVERRKQGRGYPPYRQTPKNAPTPQIF